MAAAAAAAAAVVVVAVTAACDGDMVGVHQHKMVSAFTERDIEKCTADTCSPITRVRLERINALRNNRCGLVH